VFLRNFLESLRNVEWRRKRAGFSGGKQGVIYSRRSENWPETGSVLPTSGGMPGISFSTRRPTWRKTTAPFSARGAPGGNAACYFLCAGRPMNRIRHVPTTAHTVANRRHEFRRSMFVEMFDDELLHDLRHRFLLPRRFRLQPGNDLRFEHEV
jgi:hypothetical protein